MASIGSVFLGDVQRSRLLSSPGPVTPPSVSPPASPQQTSTSGPSITAAISVVDDRPESTTAGLSTNAVPQTSTSIDPVLALDLRLRWLEALLLGVKSELGSSTKGKVQHGKHKTLQNEAQTLYRLADGVQHRLETIVDGNEGIRRFMAQYDQYAHFLSPSFVLSTPLSSSETQPQTPTKGQPPAPSYSSLSSEEIDALLTEMESDIRAADRDMKEVETLEARGVVGAGKLVEHEGLKPRLKALVEAHHENAKKMAELERRITSIVERHAGHVDTLSELFVEWDDALTAADDQITRFEKEKDERLRLGFEAHSATANEPGVENVLDVPRTEVEVDQAADMEAESQPEVEAVV